VAKYCNWNGVRAIVGDGDYVWLPGDGGAWVCDRNDVNYVLEKRTRNPKDETYDTGWYLYDDKASGFFGEWCAKLLLEAVDKANSLIAAEEAT